MRFVGSFDPSASANGQMSVGTIDPNCKVLLYNLSIVSIILSFEDGSTDILHAGEAKYWTLGAPTPTLNWKQYAVLNAQPGPLSTVTITVYESYEDVEGTYPMSLIYILNLGNSVPLTTSATSITNSGNAAGTDVLTAQVTGDGSNAVVLTNDAHLTLGDATYPGHLSSDNVNASTISANTLNIATVNSGTENVTTVNVNTVNAGTTNSSFVNTNTITVNTVLNLLKGSIKRIGKATGSNTQTITHNWGVQADAVLAYYNGAFGTPPTQALAVQNENANSFQVVGQTGYSWTVLYIGF